MTISCISTYLLMYVVKLRRYIEAVSDEGALFWPSLFGNNIRFLNIF